MQSNSVHFRSCPALAIGLMLTTPSFAQEANPSVSFSVISMLVPLVLVLAAMVGALILVRRRFGIASGDGPMRVRQVLAVGPRERVVMIDIDRHTVILGVTSANVSQIAVLDRISSNITAVADEQRKS